jgi:hypothetical protein
LDGGELSSGDLVIFIYFSALFRPIFEKQNKSVTQYMGLFGKLDEKHCRS